MQKTRGYPQREEAEQMLLKAEGMNPGKWAGHSRYTAKAAENIAAKCSGMDPEKAYVLGLLHDIGRRYGITKLRHALDGYKFCMEHGYTDCARICLTHSFQTMDVADESCCWDGSEEDYGFLCEYIMGTKADDYDKLIQLCDALAMPDGFCMVERRLVDVARRYGVKEGTLKGWEATFAIKEYFEQWMGTSIYYALPRVEEDIFRS